MNKRKGKNFFKIIFYPIEQIVKGFIYFYKCCISPLYHNEYACIYVPTCSTYAIESINRFGIFKGCFLGMKRIIKCRPGKVGGIDRVPENIKGEFKWLI